MPRVPALNASPPPELTPYRPSPTPSWPKPASEDRSRSAHGTLTNLFANCAEFVALLVVLVAVDFATGVWKAKREGQRIQSRALRQTVVKAVEYVVLCGVWVGLANALGAGV